MINKVHFGKRITSFRKSLNVTQDALAEKLGVTSQAVSKWECGTALPELESLLQLSDLFHVSINDLLVGNNFFEKIVNSQYKMDEIAYFLPEHEHKENAEWTNSIVSEKRIARNWDASIHHANPVRSCIGRQIAERGGLILEVGAGPGGGFMPYILHANPDAAIIINDLSPTVVREWKHLLDRKINSPNIHYAVFDFCDIPFTDNSIDVVSDGGGIGNAEGNIGNALKETYRVLKPGGILITSTGFVTKETLAALPVNCQEVLKSKRPDIFDDLYEETILAGYHKINSIVSGGWSTNDDDSLIADLARELGINISFTSYVRFCEK
ncbi:MAG: methyltransferase domain-containing protein [Christensenellales bacterium]